MPTYTVTSFPIQLTLDPAFRGTTWSGLTVDGMSSDGTTFSANLAAAKMSFVLAGASTEALSLTSAAGDITITDAAAWAFRVEEITPWALAKGVYYWSIELTDADGIIDVYFTGTIQTKADAVGL